MALLTPSAIAKSSAGRLEINPADTKLENLAATSVCLARLPD